MGLRRKILSFAALYILMGAAFVLVTNRTAWRGSFWSGITGSASSERGLLFGPRLDHVVAGLSVAALVVVFVPKLFAIAWRLLFMRGMRRFFTVFPILITMGCGTVAILSNLPGDWYGRLVVNYGSEVLLDMGALPGLIAFALLVSGFRCLIGLSAALFLLPQKLRAYLDGRARERERLLVHRVRALVDQGCFAGARAALERLNAAEYDVLLAKRLWARRSGEGEVLSDILTSLASRTTDIGQLNGIDYDMFLLARKGGHFPVCWEHAQRAYQRGCRAGWVYDTYLSHAISEKDWPACSYLIDAAEKDRCFSESLARRRRAAFHTARALVLMQEGHTQEALCSARNAPKCDHGFYPGHVVVAEARLKNGLFHQALDCISNAWLKDKHPFLTQSTIRLVQEGLREGCEKSACTRSEESGWKDHLLEAILDRFGGADRPLPNLDEMSEEHYERRLLVAGLYLLFGDHERARAQLYPLSSCILQHASCGANASPDKWLREFSATRRVCLLMMEVEQAGGCAGESVKWAKMALNSPEEACWRGKLGFKTPLWVPVDPKTGFFDEMIWR